ncbi:MAG: hypothetical protein A2Y12_20595 [Planctomycetes bacterium GWF2_42_9]|nr:MAG: hypothetical protein A2Y12_20595 [Planctomycetes bacterium GWF2_42_9]
MEKIEIINAQSLEKMLNTFLQQRLLPDSFLYISEQGKENWLALESNERFPIAASLTALMKEHAGSIASHARDISTLVSIGAVDAKKEFILLTELLKNRRLSCQIVDVSSQMVDVAMEMLCALRIDLHGIVAFCEDMEILAQYWGRPVLLCLLGNNFCNYDPMQLLKQVSRNLNERDLFLFDCHLCSSHPQREEKWRHDVEEVYNSSQNIKFNIAPLVSRGMDPDCCQFELKLIQVDSPWGQIYRTRKQIKFTRNATVQCGADSITFSKGEIIGMGFTYKYRMTQLLAYMKEYNYNIIQSWFDSTGDNVMILAKK